MKITDIRVKPMDKEDSKMKGIASVVIDDCFAVHDIRIIDGVNGLFVAMPSRARANGDYKDVAHPINQETRDLFSEQIIAAYKQELEKEAE